MSKRKSSSSSDEECTSKRLHIDSGVLSKDMATTSTKDSPPKQSFDTKLLEALKHYDTFYESAPLGLVKEDSERPEDCIPDLPEKSAARDFLAKAPTKGLWMPLGKEVKVIKCWRCKTYGHRTGDKECPMFLSGNKESEQFRFLHEDSMYEYIQQNEFKDKQQSKVDQLRALLDQTSTDSSSSSSDRIVSLNDSINSFPTDSEDQQMVNWLVIIYDFENVRQFYNQTIGEVIDNIRIFVKNRFPGYWCHDSDFHTAIDPIYELLAITEGFISKGVIVHPIQNGVPNAADDKLIEIIKKYINRKFGLIVIITNDGDFVEAVEDAQNMGCFVSLIHTTVSMDLYNIADDRVKWSDFMDTGVKAQEDKRRRRRRNTI